MARAWRHMSIRQFPSLVFSTWQCRPSHREFRITFASLQSIRLAWVHMLHPTLPPSNHLFKRHRRPTIFMPRPFPIPRFWSSGRHRQRMAAALSLTTRWNMTHRPHSAVASTMVPLDRPQSLLPIVEAFRMCNLSPFK